MPGHAELAQREGGEYTDHVEIDQAARICLIDHDENDCESGEGQDSVAEGQTVASGI